MRYAVTILLVLLTVTPVRADSFDFGDWVGQSVARFVDLVQHLGWVSDDVRYVAQSLDFGSHDVGTTSTADLEVVNSGTDTAEEVAISAGGAAFSLYSTTTFGNISSLPGTNTRPVKVKFTPPGAGVFTGFLRYSAPNIPRVDVALSGTGVAPDAAPTTPVITATAGDTLVTIARTSSEAGSPSPTYNLKRGTVSGTRSVVASAISLPYSDTGLANGTPYYYSLVATNTSGTAESGEVSATPGVVTYSDSFTGADATTLTAHDGNWSGISATYPDTWTFIYSNTAQANLSKAAGFFYAPSSSDTSQVVFKGVPAVTSGVTKRVHVRANTDVLGYAAQIVYAASGTATNATIQKNGAYLGSISVTGIDTTLDHTFALVASGSPTLTLTLYLDGVSKGTVTDPAPLATGHPGWTVAGGTLAAYNQMDDWKDYRP